MPYKKQRDVDSLLEQYPSLQAEGAVLSGFLEVDENDEYQVEVILGEFPRKFPVVKEIEGRIPNDVDRHKYSNNSLCLTTDAYEIFLLRKGIISNLIQFMEKVVIPFFQNNSYYEVNKKYKDGEYTHGALGNIESYFDILKIKKPEIIIDSLIKRLKNIQIGVNSPCVCGSGKKFKNCHQRRYNDLFLQFVLIFRRYFPFNRIWIVSDN